MSKKTDFTVWYINLTGQSHLVEKLAKHFKSSSLILQPWCKETETVTGLILINGHESYEQLVSVLNFQLRYRNNRIIVANTSTDRMANETVLKMLNYGTECFLENSFLIEPFECIIEKLRRWQDVEIMLHAPSISKSIVGGSTAIRKMLRGIIEVAAYSDASVLIQGERGTGKELIAGLIHNIDKIRNGHNLVLVDCTTIRPELSGSEFFGHEKGSYTGADSTREGAFALANNGTLFLDEVGETPLQMQAELLRVIQEGTYKKVGSNIWKQTDFRLVCATNRNLIDEGERGCFRKDLYDRISIWKCYMPSLNERKQDIPLLVDFFLQKKFPEQTPVIDESVIEYLTQRDYPGNIRELKNLITRISLKYIGKGAITLGDVPEEDRNLKTRFDESWYESAVFTNKITEALNSGYDAKNILDTVKSIVTKVALATAGNNKEVSQLLGKSERWIQLQKAKER